MPAPHVLVVDDEPDIRDLLRMDLETAGYRVSVADDGVAALEALEGALPDLVLLDVMMPRMDGWQVLARIRRDERLTVVPVVMLTALSSEADVIRGRLSGAVRYVTKPFELEDLLATVAEAVRPPSDEVRERRSAETRELLRRLAELEAGRQGGDPPVRFSRLETRRVESAGPAVDPAAAAALTERQRQVAGMLAAGLDARTVARRLGSSRANVYATRQRIARTLGVDPEQVAEVARTLGLASSPSPSDDPGASG